MSDNSGIGTVEQLKDPDYTPPLIKAVPLGIQHVLAMFVSNVTPAIIVAGAAGFGFGSNSPDFPNLIYMIQMSMLFAGIATLIQTIGMGPVGARLPIVQGTSFAFLPIMIPLVAGQGVSALGGLMGGVIIGGIFHFFLGTFIGRIRFALPPLVTGLIVLMIGLALVKVGIQYAAGGVPAIGKPEFGSFQNWFVALVVIFVTLGVKFFTRGMLSVAAVLIGLIAGYAVAYILGMVSFANVERAANFALPEPFKWGFSVGGAAVIGFCFMAIISAIETVGDVSGITKGGAGREATDKEISGATYADGLGTAVAGIFGGLPNTSFSQNVGLISMTGVMSRHVVTIGALFLIACGLVPKIGAVISTVPIEVLGGGVIVMFGMVAAAGVNMLSDVAWNRRNMLIFATALSVGLGLQLVPEAVQHLPDLLKILLTSGLLPAAAIAIILNLILPEEEEEADATALAGLSSQAGMDEASGAVAAQAEASAISEAAGQQPEAPQPATASALVATAEGEAPKAKAATKSTKAKRSTAASKASASRRRGKAKAATASTSGKRSSSAKSKAKPAASSKAAAEKGRPPKMKKPAKPDDLKLISGVGPKLETVLNGLGIYKYEQVAKWKKAERDWVDGYLKFKGRIERDDWVKQAKALAKGGEAEYIKVFGKKPR